MKILNFDKAATTTLTPRVKKAMKQALKYEGNPSVNCIEGNKARDIIDSSRATIAKILNTSEDNIFFTSGGTEGNNQALMSMAIEGIKQNKKHIIVSAIEHHAVLKMAEWLSEYMGFTISYVQPSKNFQFGWGAIDAEQIKSLITPQTIGVSVMCVNNETGIINDITWIAKMCSHHNLLLHVDAVQSISADGLFKIFNLSDIAYLTVSAHKFHGPKGVGFIYTNNPDILHPYLHGGQQEYGKRAGTENLLGIVGMTEAFREVRDDLFKSTVNYVIANHYLTQELQTIPEITINFTDYHRTPAIISCFIKGVDATTIQMELANKGICVSTGSACTTNDLAPSHVLTSMGFTPEEANHIIRLSIDKYTTTKQIDKLIAELKLIIKTYKK